MTVKPRRPMDDRPSPRLQVGDLARAKKPAGRPKGEPSTIVNVRLPLTLVQPGGKKNPFSVRFDWAIMLPYAQTTLPEE